MVSSPLGRIQHLGILLQLRAIITAELSLFHKVPITAGYAEAVWSEKIAWHFYKPPAVGIKPPTLESNALSTRHISGINNPFHVPHCQLNRNLLYLSFFCHLLDCWLILTFLLSFSMPVTSIMSDSFSDIIIFPIFLHCSFLYHCQLDRKQQMLQFSLHNDFQIAFQHEWLLLF